MKAGNGFLWAELVSATALGPAMCPVCGDKHIRLVQVRCSRSDGTRGEVAIDSRGVHIDKSAKGCSAGGGVSIDFSCGKNHIFSAIWVDAHKQTLQFLLVACGKCTAKAIWQS